MRDAWWAGLYSATDKQDERVLEEIATQTTIGAISEAKGVPMLPDWESVGCDVKIIFMPQHWRLIEHGAQHIATVDWKRGNSPRDEVLWNWAFLRNTHTNLKVLRIATHLPAHLFRLNQRRANQMALDDLERVMVPVQEAYKPDLTNLSMDANRDVRLDRNKKIIKQAIKPLGLKLVIPPEGTEKRRKIDVFGTDGNVTEIAMFDDMPGRDHMGIHMTVHA